jgi:hypothetical protein
MAKRQTDRPTATPSAQPQQTNGTAETVAGYFRRVFAEHPEWLEAESNDAVYARWLQDHPEHSEVPVKIKQSLYNTKSVLQQQRKKGGRRKKKKKEQAAERTAAPRKRAAGLEALELAVDDCLSLARKMDSEGLADVIGFLRQARNAVVWKMGE